MSKRFQSVAALVLLAWMIGLWWVGVAQPAIASVAADRAEMRIARLTLARYTRLARLAPSARQDLASYAAQASASAFFVIAGPPALLASDMQRQITSLIQRPGVQIRSIKTIPPDREGLFERIGVDVDFSTDLDVLVSILTGMRAHQPYFEITKLSIAVPELGAAPIADTGLPVLQCRAVLHAFVAPSYTPIQK